MPVWAVKASTPSCRAFLGTASERLEPRFRLPPAPEAAAEAAADAAADAPVDAPGDAAELHAARKPEKLASPATPAMPLSTLRRVRPGFIDDDGERGTSWLVMGPPPVRSAPAMFDRPTETDTIGRIVGPRENGRASCRGRGEWRVQAE